jgi:hypothetical protein
MKIQYIPEFYCCFIFIFFILWHDAWNPEVRRRRNTKETSVARQRLRKYCSRGNKLTNVFMRTKESTILLCVHSPVRLKPAHAEIQNPELEFEKARN